MKAIDSPQRADGWEEMPLPEIERKQKQGKQVVFRADAAFAKPELYEALEEQGVKNALRIPTNDTLGRDIVELPTRRLFGGDGALHRGVIGPNRVAEV